MRIDAQKFGKAVPIAQTVTPSSASESPKASWMCSAETLMKYENNASQSIAMEKHANHLSFFSGSFGSHQPMDSDNRNSTGKQTMTISFLLKVTSSLVSSCRKSFNKRVTPVTSPSSLTSMPV